VTASTPWILVVEDAAGEAVLRRLLADLAPHWHVEFTDVCGGVDRIRSRLVQYRQASHVYPHLLLADLDRHRCPSALLAAWSARSEPPRLMLRVAVREVEAWLLADRGGTADWLQVPATKIPVDPEAESDPKATLLGLAKRSRSRRFALEFCPKPGSAASQGPLYNAHLRRFVREEWDPRSARAVAPSLDRACRRIAEWAGA
jgi:hypothetical protein